MITPGRWLTLAGALALLLGFFLPFMTISSTVETEMNQSVRLVDLAEQRPVLYLVVLGGMTILVLSVIPAVSKATAFQFLLGQTGGVILALLGFAAPMISLYREASSYNSLGMGLINVSDNFYFTPSIGLFLLGAGFVEIAVGLIIESTKIKTGRVNTRSLAPPPVPASQALLPFPPAQRSLASLEVARGDLAGRSIPVAGPDFMIGRGAGCHLQLVDLKASRQHARLRFAQGIWFIQDPNSVGGTFVNGQRVKASRLNAGDQITIGDTTFIFRL